MPKPEPVFHLAPGALSVADARSFAAAAREAIDVGYAAGRYGTEPPGPVVCNVTPSMDALLAGHLTVLLETAQTQAIRAGLADREASDAQA